MNIRECFEKRLLLEDRPDPRRSGRSMEVAEAKLEEAEKALRYALPDAMVILAYTACSTLRGPCFSGTGS